MNQPTRQKKHVIFLISQYRPLDGVVAENWMHFDISLAWLNQCINA
jgi:hypothetical protein